MMRGDTVSFSQINSAVWESPRPFRAMILQRMQQALFTPLSICAVVAGFCWLFGITFAATAFPTGVAILLCSFSACGVANAQRLGWVKVVRTLPLHGGVLTRFALAMLGLVYSAAFVSCAPWLYFAWDQSGTVILTAYFYGAGLACLQLGSFTVGRAHARRIQDRTIFPPRVIYLQFVIFALIAAPMISANTLLWLTPIVFLFGICSLVYVVPRYPIP